MKMSLFLAEVAAIAITLAGKSTRVTAMSSSLVACLILSCHKEQPIMGSQVTPIRIQVLMNQPAINNNVVAVSLIIKISFKQLLRKKKMKLPLQKIINTLRHLPTTAFLDSLLSRITIKYSCHTRRRIRIFRNINEASCAQVNKTKLRAVSITQLRIMPCPPPHITIAQNVVTIFPSSKPMTKKLKLSLLLPIYS